MRFLFLSLAFFLNLIVVNAQQVDWFADSPRWDVFYTAGFAGGGYEHVTIDRDTMLGGRAAKVFARETFAGDFIDVVAQNGDSIFLWNDMDQIYYLLYNMAAPIGTEFSQPTMYSTDFITYKVEEAGTMQVDGQTLRFQEWLRPTSTSGETYLVIEKIGMVYWKDNSPNSTPRALHYFWNQPNTTFVDGPGWNLCQYSDQNIEYVPVANSLYCVNIVDVPFIASSDFDVSIAPNPAVSEVSFSFKKKVSEGNTLELYNLYGQRVRKSNFFIGSYTLQRDNLPGGVYVFSLKNRDGIVVQSGKLVFVN